MANAPLIIAHALFASMLISGVVVGVRRWKDTTGKVIAIVAGMLLLCHLAFIALVLLLVISSLAGHPA
jgi:hypothetical protein